MLCKKCNTENIIKAEYCKHCGAPFTQEERDTAYGQTVYGKIDKISNGWNKITSVANLSFITDSAVFKYGLLVLIIVYGLLAGRPGGNKMTVLDGDNYSIQQNKTNGEYYILTETDPVTLNLYLPQQADSLNIKRMDEDGFVLSDFWFSPEDSIILSASTENYYCISADYADSSETIKVYVVME